MKKIWTAVLCLGLIGVLGVQHLSAADPERATWRETKVKLKTEGWKQISEGVFERQRTDTQVEHLGYGREGLIWTIGQLKGRLNSLREEYQRHPSEDLAKVIDNLTIRIADAREELRSSSREDVPSLNEAASIGCNLCYSATVDAYSLTSSQGVGAVADAKFNSSCGNSGNTYAYAYARATLNGTTTTKTQEDPRSGSNAASYATATMNGSVDCFSEAYAATQSSALGISYSTTKTNYLCPVVATLTASISGTTYEYFAGGSCRTRSWTGSASGGTAPYTYQWYSGSTVVGTGSTYSRSVCPSSSSFLLKLVVTDSSGATAQATNMVTVESEPMCGQYVC